MAPDPDGSPLLDNLRPSMTGAYFISLYETAPIGRCVDALARHSRGPVSVATVTDGAAFPRLGDRRVLLLEDLMIAVMTPGQGQDAAGLMQALDGLDEVEEVRPETYVFRYQSFRDTATATWGIAATGALASPYTGRGIKLAVLDTGIDSGHPDFEGRTIVSRSFVEGESADDAQGHGTHCAGTAAGRARSQGVPRYGVAPEAALYVGKVLNNSGYGTERDIVSGMAWAIDQGCEVISMSLGSAVRPGEKHSVVYERLGRRALERGSLICAAAGNDSNRSFGTIAPVGSPANAPSILAVGAVDPKDQPAYFSNGGVNPEAPLDLCAPGTGVFSAVPRPQLYRSMNGTSMACPHVAGVAALWAESDPNLRGLSLWQALTGNARRLAGNPRDVGAGLVQAPAATQA